MTKSWLFALANASLVAACVLDEAEEVFDEHVLEQELVGAAGMPPPEIVYAVRTTSRASDRRAVFLVRDNLALGLHVPRWSTKPDRLTYENTTVSGDIKFVNTTMAQSGFAIYQLDRPSGGTDKIDARSAAALAGITLECWDPRGYFRSALVTVTGGTATTLTTSRAVANEFIEAADIGAPCVTTTSPRKLVGFVTSANVPARTAVLVRAEAMRSWVDGLINLARVRDDARTLGPYSISTDPAAIGASRMCMDLPGEQVASGIDVQQYPCHHNLNQLFYLDRSDLSSLRPRVVSAVSGRCLDVEWGDAIVGRTLQQFDCHSNPNQKFERKASGALVPDSGIAANLCIGVRGGVPTTAPAWTEQQVCLANPNAFHQQWRYDARALPTP